MLFTFFGLACLALYETITGKVETPGIWIPLVFAFGLHVLLALAIFLKEIRAEPAPFLHWFDGITLGLVWWVGPFAWAKERQKRRQITSAEHTHLFRDN